MSLFKELKSSGKFNESVTEGTWERMLISIQDFLESLEVNSDLELKNSDIFRWFRERELREIAEEFDL